MADQDLTPEAVERLATDLLRLDVAYKMPTCITAAHTLAALSTALEAERGWHTVAESNQQIAQSWQACAEIAGAERDKEHDRAEAAEAKLKDAMDVMQAWKNAGTGQDYYQAVQKRNAFLASLEGDKP